MNGSSGPPGRPGAPLRVAAYLALWSELVFSCFRAGTAKNSSSKVPSRQLTPSCYDGAKIPLFVLLRAKLLEVSRKVPYRTPDYDWMAKHRRAKLQEFVEVREQL